MYLLIILLEQYPWYSVEFRAGSWSRDLWSHYQTHFWLVWWIWLRNVGIFYDYLFFSLSTSKLPICLYKNLKHLCWIILYKCSTLMLKEETNKAQWKILLRWVKLVVLTAFLLVHICSSQKQKQCGISSWSIKQNHIFSPAFQWVSFLWTLQLCFTWDIFGCLTKWLEIYNSLLVTQGSEGNNRVLIYFSRSDSWCRSLMNFC